MLKKHTELAGKTDLIAPGELESVKSVLNDSRGLTTSITESLGSIGIGIAAVGLTVVSVVAGWNFFQDSGAKETLNAVKTAQVLQQSRTNAYGDVTALTSGQDPALKQSASSLNIAATDKFYCAAIKSPSMFGPSYWVSAKTGAVTDTKPSATEAGMTCPDPVAG